MTAHADQYPLLPGTGPTSGLPSGEKVKAPLTQVFIPTFSIAG